MNVNDKQVIAFLRAKASALTAAADALEGKTPCSSPEPRGEASKADVLNYVKGKKARPKDLARFFRCSEALIREIVSEMGSGMRLNDRGWVMLDPTNTPFEI